MKEIIIPLLIIINALTLYFFVFPYQSYSDYNSLKEVTEALKTQINLTNLGIEKITNELINTANFYPKLNINKAEVRKKNIFFKNIHNNLKTLEGSLYEQLTEYYDIDTFHNQRTYSFWYRVQPFHYQVPQNALFTNGRLAKTITDIDESQTTILTKITDETLKQVLVDSFFIDTKALPQLLKNKSLVQTIAIITKLKNQITMAEYQFVNQILENINNQIPTNQLHLRGFVPLLSVKKRTIKKGETFEAEIYTTPIMTHDSLKFFINNKRIPSKNGLVNYQFIPKSTQNKLFNVRVEYNSSYHEEVYRNQFEIDVVDCQ